MKNKTYLITGASSGIGYNLAEYLASLGANLILLAKNQKTLENAQAQLIKQYNTDIILCPFNLANAQADNYLALEHALSEHATHLDGLIHCAGMLEKLTPLEQLPMAQWQLTMQVNLNARFLLTQSCLPLLRLANKAQVLFIQSDAAHNSRQNNWGAYQVAENASNSLITLFQQELAHTNINFESILLPPMQTKLRKKVFPFEESSAVSPLNTLKSIWPQYFVN